MKDIDYYISLDVQAMKINIVLHNAITTSSFSPIQYTQFRNMELVTAAELT